MRTKLPTKLPLHSGCLSRFHRFTSRASVLKRLRYLTVPSKTSLPRTQLHPRYHQDLQHKARTINLTKKRRIGYKIRGSTINFATIEGSWICVLGAFGSDCITSPFLPLWISDLIYSSMFVASTYHIIFNIETSQCHQWRPLFHPFLLAP